MTDTPPPSPGTPTPPIPPSGPTGASPDPADVEKNKVMACLAYIGILVLVPLLAAKESPFARYHTNQGLILVIATIIAGIAIGILSFIAAFIPFVGLCFSCIAPLVFLAGWLTLVIIGILNAVNGRMKPLPVIGTLFTIIK